MTIKDLPPELLGLVIEPGATYRTDAEEADIAAAQCAREFAIVLALQG